MDSGVVKQIRLRAASRCEYCHLPDYASEFSFWIDHIVPRKHGGGDSMENLAWSCPFCNRYKGTNLAGIDPTTGRIAPLFHPRTEAWSDHFAWSGSIMVGLTAIGRATINVMAMNLAIRVDVRASLAREGYVF